MPTAATFAPTLQAKKANRSSKFITVHFVSYGSTTPAGVARFSGKNGHQKGATPTWVQSAVAICTVSEVAELALEIQGEETLVLPGKTDEKRWDSIAFSTTVTLQGNAVGTIKYMLGISPHTNEAIDWDRSDFGLSGALIINSYSDAKTLVMSTCVANVKLRFPSVGGVANSGSNMQQITFYSEEAKLKSVVGSVIWSPIIFLDNGASITNATAPDGIITAFILDDCNNSQTTTPPQPVAFNPSATGLDQYFIVARLDGANLASDGAALSTSGTFVTATLTLGAAPADGTSILLICAIDTAAYVVPLLHTNNGGMGLLSETYMGIIA